MSKVQHEFWNTQPVPQTPAEAVKECGPIEEQDISKVRQTPLPLPEQYHWEDLDITQDEKMSELVQFLHDNYIADVDGEFAFDYDKEVVKWACLPPLAAQYPDFSFGFRDNNGNLMGYINGSPCDISAAGTVVKAIIVDFLCVHTSLRGTRLAPVLIAEIKRRANTHGIWQAVYTGASLLPTPVSITPYYHRVIDWEKAAALDFIDTPASVPAKLIAKKYELPQRRKTSQTFTRIVPLTRDLVPAVRELTMGDLKRQKSLLYKYFESDDDFFFEYKPRDGVLISLVALNADGKPVSFGSFTIISSFRRDMEKKMGMNDKIRLPTAYLNGVFVDPAYSDASSTNECTARQEMMLELLYAAKEASVTVFNVLDLSQNSQFMPSLGFMRGTGCLHYYIYNYRLGKNVRPRDIALILA